MEVFFFLAILIGFIWAVLGSRDQARTLEAGEPVGSTWHHMVQILKRRVGHPEEKTLEVEQPAKPPMPSPQKPFRPLTKQQRKRLKLKERNPLPKFLHQPPSRQPEAKKEKTTRAIQRGWSIGTVEFLYEDAEGDISHRQVTVHSVTSIYIKGECHTRQAERTFRIDRVIGDITDCDTGEMSAPQKWARKLQRQN